MNIFFLFLLFFFNTGGFSDHDIHASKATVHYNTGSESFEVSMHIFIDDLESIIESQNEATKLRIATSAESSITDSLIAAYIRDHFRIVVDGRRVPLEFIGKETSHDLMAVWCYLEGMWAREIESLILTNSVLMDLYDDQKNLVEVLVKDEKDYLLFNRKQKELKVTVR